MKRSHIRVNKSNTVKIGGKTNPKHKMSNDDFATETEDWNEEYEQYDHNHETILAQEEIDNIIEDSRFLDKPESAEDLSIKAFEISRGYFRWNNQSDNTSYFAERSRYDEMIEVHRTFIVNFLHGLNHLLAKELRDTYNIDPKKIHQGHIFHLYQTNEEIGAKKTRDYIRFGDEGQFAIDVIYTGRNIRDENSIDIYEIENGNAEDMIEIEESQLEDIIKAEIDTYASSISSISNDKTMDEQTKQEEIKEIFTKKYTRIPNLPPIEKVRQYSILRSKFPRKPRRDDDGLPAPSLKRLRENPKEKKTSLLEIKKSLQVESDLPSVKNRIETNLKKKEKLSKSSRLKKRRVKA